MNCTDVQERMMDVLYGELLDSRGCFQFYRHLEECADCRREYDELVGTRHVLSQWDIEESFQVDRPMVGPRRPKSSMVGFWTWAQRVAALVLILLGGWSLVERAVPALAGDFRVAKDELHPLVANVVEEKLARERRILWRGMQNGLDALHSDFASLKSEVETDWIPTMGRMVYGRLKNDASDGLTPVEQLEEVKGH